jgi:hypothetical protein
MVDQSAHPHHINGLKTLYMYGVDVGTIPGGSWASSNKHEERNWKLNLHNMA